MDTVAIQVPEKTGAMSLVNTNVVDVETHFIYVRRNLAGVTTQSMVQDDILRIVHAPVSYTHLTLPTNSRV